MNGQENNNVSLRRRTFLQSAVGLAVAGITEFPNAAPSAQNGDSVFDPFTGFMKMYSSLTPSDHWWWFKGHMDLISPGHRPTPFIGASTLIRRQVRLDSDGRIVTRGWEGVIYSNLETGKPADSLFNPVNQRTIHPFHSKEGPTASIANATGIRRGLDNGTETEVKPFDFPTTVAGDDVWLQRDFRFVVPHPMSADEWPEESSGEPYWTNLVTIFRAKLSDLKDDSIDAAPADFVLSGQVQVPAWMQMGRFPGSAVGWIGVGKKLFSLDEMPPEELESYRSYHPNLFARGDPWEEPLGSIDSYMKEREPVRYE